MYNRTPRFGVEYPTRTPPEVGPYTYLLDDPLEVNRVNVVPFASSSERNNVCINRKYTDALYNLRELGDNIKGGNSLRNTAERFVYKESDVPPPGTYNPQPLEKRKKPSNEIPPGKGKIYLCKVPFSVMGNAPSIPTKRDQNGYDIGHEGKLIKIEPPNPQRNIGPSTYNLNVSSCVKEDTYSGCHWSRRTSVRTMFQTRESPGPGHYDIQKVSTCRWNENEEEFREMARRFSYLPRYLEQQFLITEKNNYPAPCAYNKSSCFDYKPPVTTVKKPFMFKRPRFEGPKVRDQAFHTMYNTEAGRTIGYKPTPSVKEVPFSYAAERFPTKDTPAEIPELFVPKGFTELISEKNSKPYILFRPPFDSTVPREINFVPYDSHLKPDCTLYPREEKHVQGRSIENGNSVFVSTTGRSDVLITAAPPVTKYAISEPFKKNRDRTSHNKKRLSFQATAERKTVVLPLKNNPGPADYLGKRGIEGKGFIFDRSQRFKKDKSDIPPPDHYYIHPLYSESVFSAKNTFNLMIAESILKKRLRLPPKDSFKDYVKSLKKKKMLKCYTTIMDEM